MLKVYDFREQVEQELFYNETLDKYFSKWFYITQPNKQNDGIDRLFIHKNTNVKHYVEYKSDVRSADTGNAFIETKSSERKLGWVYTIKADILIIYSPLKGIIYSISAPIIKEKAKEWTMMFRTGYAKTPKNGGFYTTEGILVPLDYIEEISLAVRHSPELQCTYNDITLVPALF